MRKASKPQHPLGILRGIIGIGQTDLAKLVGRSPRTIQAVEINRLPLSEELAQRISHETGVALTWLLDGDVKAAPSAESALVTPYTKKIFEERRAKLEAGENPDFWATEMPRLTEFLGIPQDKKEEEVLASFMRLVDPVASFTRSFDTDFSRIASSLCAANKVGRARLASYRLHQFARSMSEEFGQQVDEEFAESAGEMFVSSLANILAARVFMEGKQRVFYSPHVEKNSWSVPPDEDYLDATWQIDDPNTFNQNEEAFAAAVLPAIERLGMKESCLRGLKDALSQVLSSEANRKRKSTSSGVNRTPAPNLKTKNKKAA